MSVDLRLVELRILDLVNGVGSERDRFAGLVSYGRRLESNGNVVSGIGGPESGRRLSTRR